MSAGQSKEGQTVVPSLDGLNEVKTTTTTTTAAAVEAATSNSGSSSSCCCIATTKMTSQQQRNLAGVNVGMKPGADIRTRDSFNDQDNNEPIDIDPNVCGSGVSNNNCSECPGCKQKLDAFKANDNTNNNNNITSERETLMSQQLNGGSTATTATTTIHEDGTSRDQQQQRQQQQQQGQPSRGHLCNSNGELNSLEDRHEGDSSSHYSLVNCNILDNVQKNITSTSLMSRNNQDKEQGYCLVSEANRAKHFQCTEMLEDCCGCCCDEQQQQPQPQPQQPEQEKEIDACKLTSNPLNNAAGYNCSTTAIDCDEDQRNDSKKEFATSMMVSLDIGGGGRERVVSELVAPPEKEYNDELKVSRNKQRDHNMHVNNLLKIIQESQLALYWRQIKSQLYRRRHEKGLNSTEPDTSTDREIGHTILVDETGQGTLINVCKSCNCTTIQTNNNNNNNNNLDDRSTTIIKLGDGTTTKLLLDDEANLNTTSTLNIAESTANIAVSTVNPPKNTTIISTTTTTTTSPNSVPQHSQVIATSITTTKTVTTTTTNTTEGIESKRERKAAKTLAIITGVFVMCWLPFFVMAITMPLLNLKPHKYVFALMLWLGYVNSMLNPIIYTIFSPDFRKAFKRLLCAMDDSNEIRRRKRMRGAGGYGTSTSQLQTTYGRSTLVGSNAGGGGGAGYVNSNSLSSDNSQQNKSCNIMADNNNYNKNRFFDFKCLSEQYQRYLNNLCNNLPLISKFCCCSSNLSSTSSNSSHDQDNNNNNNDNSNYNSTREQSLRRIAMKNNSGRQQTNEVHQNKNLRNNVNNTLNDTELDNYKNNNQEREVSDNNNNNNDKYLDNNQLVEPDRCSPMRRLYLLEQREQEQQQQGTITTNRPGITKNDF